MNLSLNRCVGPIVGPIAAGVVSFLTASCERDAKPISLRDKLEFGFSESQVVEIVGGPLFLNATMLVEEFAEVQLQHPNGIYYSSKPIFLNEGARQIFYILGFGQKKELIEISSTANRLGTTPLDEITETERSYRERYERNMTSRNLR